jgi:chemotaxis protein MotB
MARKQPPEEHENHERWLVSYADFITLLFAFFVVMYSISSLNAGKYKVLSQTLVAAFTGKPTTPDPIQTGQPYSNAPSLINLPALPRPTSLVPSPARAKELHGPRSGDLLNAPQSTAAVAQALANRFAMQIRAGQVQVRTTPLGVVIDIHDNLLFASGQTTLSPGAQALLLQLAGVISSLPDQFQVNGYTDDVPIRTAQFQSNWDLSAMRAVTVVDILIGQGVPPAQLVAAGYGQYHPIASNATDQGRAANRRVSIVIVTAPSGAASAPGAASASDSVVNPQ